MPWCRYVKLFPLIGIEAAGLKKYSHYVCGRIAERAQTNLKQSLAAAGSGMNPPPYTVLSGQPTLCLLSPNTLLVGCRRV